MVNSLGFTGMAKYIGKQWKKVDEQVKKKYQKMAAEDKRRYALEMDAWHNEQREFLAHLEESENTVQKCNHRESQGISASQGKWCVNPNQTDQVLGGKCVSQSQSICGKRNTKQVALGCSPSGQDMLTFRPNTCISNLILDANALQKNANKVFPLGNRAATFGHDSKETVFDEKKSLLNMARDFGDEGINYLLTVLVPVRQMP